MPKNSGNTATVTAGEEEEKYGKPYRFDPTFNGPIKNRSCTDIICCVLFFVCFTGFLAVGVWAFVMGDPRILIYPTDSEGNLCGINQMEGKPYVFFFDYLQCTKITLQSLQTFGCDTPQVCVKECPTTEFVWTLASVDSSKRKDLICKYNVDPVTSTQSVESLVFTEQCAAYYVSSSPVAGRCFPTVITQITDPLTQSLTINNTAVLDKNNNTINSTELINGVNAATIFLNIQDVGMKIFHDLAASWWLILIFLGFTTILCFFWILLMRWIAGPVVWLTIILFIVAFAIAVYYCFTKYVDLLNNPVYDSDFQLTTDFSYYINIYQTWLALGIIAAIILAIILLITIFLIKRIRIAIALIKAASRAVGHMMFTLLWPIVPFILQVAALSYWVASAVLLAASAKGQYSYANSTYENLTDAEQGYNQAKEVLSGVISYIPCNEDNSTAAEICSFFKYGGNEFTIFLQIYQLFMWLWIMNFIIAFGQITLAGAFASYYWAFHKPKDIPAFPLTYSVGRALRYHIGSLAFGALIIAIIQMIRICLEFMDRKLKKANNPVAKFLIKCCKCFFWCLEKFMKFINRNAYIMIAVYGKNFCTSAKNAFLLLMRNIIRAVVLDKVTDFLIFISKLCIVGGIGVLSFFFFSGGLAGALPPSTFTNYLTIVNPSLNYYFMPVIVIAVGSFVICSLFFSVYSMGVDTMFLCFLEDLEKHDGSKEKPYFMSKELMRILGKKNKTKSANRT